LSERTILVTERSQAESFASQTERNAVTTKDGKFNEYAFSLSSATVNSIGLAQGSGTKMFRFTIKEQGHTLASNATVEQIESSTVSPFDDVWAQENYWDVTIYSGNPATGNFTSTASNNINQGKLFGVPWGKPSTSSGTYQWNGVNFAAVPYGMYSQAGFFTGFYGGYGWVAADNATNQHTYTYHGRGDGNDGKTYTFRLAQINDLFGIYMGTENQLNHHIGTCNNSTDDFGGASYCAAGWANWRPHKFNQRTDGNYEGRIVQYWVR
jgi:hypothetical protein